MKTDQISCKTVAVTVGVAITIMVVVFTVKFLIGTLLFSHELACSEGEAPANDIYGGSACFTEGTELPEGFTWDIRGNYKIN